MSELERFLLEAAELAGVGPDAIVARVLHLSDPVFTETIAPMGAVERALAVRLDRELRLRNPGLHYVDRRMFLGYRREGDAAIRHGERSQIFASLVRKSTRLELVLPVDTSVALTIPYAQDLTGRGHHGVGDILVSFETEADIDRFLVDFDFWLNPVA